LNHAMTLAPMLTDREFQLFQDLIHRETGIFLPETKKALLIARLSKRLRVLGCETFGAYFDRVQADPATEKTVMLDQICTNETRFFREPRQFEFLDQEILPRWKAEAEKGQRRKSVRVWSAACSTGEEPYSVAMLLRSHLRAEDGWNVEVLASDLSTKVLAIAEAGVWPVERAEEIPLPYRQAYMLRGIHSQEGTMRARPELRSMIQFRRINLNEERYPVQGPFDLIFCRNVLIYFNRETKEQVVHRLATHLVPGGVLFLGHSETMCVQTPLLRHAGPTAYTRSA